MPRPFAVIGLTVFFTLAVLNDTDIGAAKIAFLLFFAALAVSLCFKNIRKERVLPCAFAAGALACALLTAANVFYYQPRVAFSGSVGEAAVRLESEPEIKYGNYYYTGRVTEFEGEKTDIKVRLVFSNPPEAEPYDTVDGNFTFYVLGESSEKYLESYRSSGIYLGAYPTDKYSVAPHYGRQPLGALILKLRSAVRSAVIRTLPNENGRLAVALLLGDRSGLSAESSAAFSKIGITHIVCVSGFHLSLWSMLILKILRKTRMPRRLAYALAMVGTVGFMLLAGLTYSVMRSGIMTLVFLLSDILMRKRDPLNSLGFALTVIGFADPFSIGSVSLRLSALATLGIILCSELVLPRLRDSAERRLPWRIRTAAVYIAEVLVTAAAAMAFTLPVSMRLYGNFNFISLLANLVITPAASPCMVLSAIGAAFGSITHIFNLFSFAGGLFAAYMLGGSKLLASSDLADFAVSEDEACAVFCALFLLCALSVLFALLGRAMPRLTAALCAAIFCCSVIGFSVSADMQTRAAMLDTGNGICVLVSKRRENLLIGAGGSTFYGKSSLNNALAGMKGTLSAAFIPSGDGEYAEYALDALSARRPKNIYYDSLPEGCELLLGGVEKHPFEGVYESENFTVHTYRTDMGCAVYIKSEDMSLLVCLDPLADITALPDEAVNADALISRSDYPQAVGGFDIAAVSADNLRGVAVGNELRALGVNAAATAGCGDLEIYARRGCAALRRR